MLQEWWGLVPHIRSVADRFAAAGFTALAPDLYHGEVAQEPDTAGKLMMALNIAATERVLSGAVDRLVAHSACSSDRVGVVGFCMGGQLSMLAATINPKIGACVNFYGIHPNVSPDYSKLSGPIMGFFAQHDDFTNAEAVNKLSVALDAAGQTYDFTTFPGTRHAFFNDERPAYDPDAAKKAWEKMVRFFGEML